MQTQLQITPAATPTPQTPTLNPVLRELIRSLTSVLASETDAERRAAGAARALQPFLGHPRLLDPPQCEPDPTRYRQHPLYTAADGSFSVVALVWMPGQATPIHDHVSWCVVGVHQGVEEEVHYDLVQRPGDPYLVPIGACTHPAGTVAALTPPGDIHLVTNPGPGIAISIHVYGADIRERGTSIRRRYDLEVRAVAEAPVH
jgi:predicted metal-dependent enzyme (double-stranded beta helix superfamily)